MPNNKPNGCSHCGKEFPKDYYWYGGNKQYCSNACRQAAYRERKAAKKKAEESKGKRKPFRLIRTERKKRNGK